MLIVDKRFRLVAGAHDVQDHAHDQRGLIFRIRAFRLQLKYVRLLEATIGIYEINETNIYLFPKK